MQPEAIIFDLDGVLCHTDHYHYLAWKQIADHLHLPFDEQRNDQLRGVSRLQSLEILLGNQAGRYSDAEKHALAEEKNAIYRSYLQRLTPADVSPGEVDTLRMLRAMHLPLAIGSSSRNARLILHQLQLTAWFDVIVDGNDIRHAKPDPEVFLLAARRLGKAPESCIVVEDAEAGLQAAQAGGFLPVGIGAAVAHIPAEWHIQQLDELPVLLQGGLRPVFR